MLEQVKYEDSPTLPRGNFSDLLIDFIARCLKKESDQRDSVVSLLAHPWILKYTQSQANLPKFFR